jgi:hypothetical protein
MFYLVVRVSNRWPVYYFFLFWTCVSVSCIAFVFLLLCAYWLLTTNLCIVNCVVDVDAKYCICLYVYMYLVQELGWGTYKYHLFLSDKCFAALKILWSVLCVLSVFILIMLWDWNKTHFITLLCLLMPVCHSWVPVLFEPKREEIAGDQSTLVNEERYDLYCWPNIIWVIKWWGMWYMLCGRKEKCMQGGKLESNRPFAGSRSRWEDNIKIDVQEVGWEDVDKWQACLNVVLNLQLL